MRASTRVLPEQEPEFQIAPMIDILLVLLVFFMSIATEQVLQVNKEVVLPVARDVTTLPPPPADFIVNLLWFDLTSKGAIVVDGREIEPSALPTMITRKMETNPDLRVIIRADKRAKYESVRSIMAALGGAGVQNVTFSAIDQEIEDNPTR